MTILSVETTYVDLFSQLATNGNHLVRRKGHHHCYKEPPPTNHKRMWSLPVANGFSIRGSSFMRQLSSKLDTFFKHLRIGENLCFLPAVCMNVALSHVDTWHGPWNYMSKSRHKHCNDDRTLSVCLTNNPSNILKQWTTKSGILAHVMVFFPTLGFCHARFTQPVDLFSTSSGSTDQVEPAASLIRGITAGCSETTHGGFACCVQKIWGSLESLSDATATLPSPAMSASLYDSYVAFKCQTFPSYLVREGCVEAHQSKLMQPCLHGCAVQSVQSLLPWSWSKYSKSCKRNLSHRPSFLCCRATLWDHNGYPIGFP
jgi:hypothetical protein